MSLPRSGPVTLEDGELVFHGPNNTTWGRMYSGPQGAVYEGELTLFQENDPPKIRLASRGGNGGGGISFNVMRADGIQEEVALTSGGQAEDAVDEHDLRGQYKVMVRPAANREIEDQQVTTSAYSAEKYGARVIYTAINRPISNLYKFNIPGAGSPTTSYEQFGLTGLTPVPPTPPAPPSPVPPPTGPPTSPVVTEGQIISADGRFVAVQQTDGNFVVYARVSMTPLWDSYSKGSGVPAGPPLPPTSPPPAPPPAPPPVSGPPEQTLERSYSLLLALMLEMSERFNTTPNYNKPAEDAPLLLANAAYAVYASTYDPLMSALLGNGWRDKYEREFRP